MAAIVAHQTFLGDILSRQAARRNAVDQNYAFPAPPHLFPQPHGTSDLISEDEHRAQTRSNVVNYVQEEETIRNDYTSWYTASGQPGSNYILGANNGEICEEYPALRRLMDLKTDLVGANAHPPIYHHLPSVSPGDIVAGLSPARFDVILVTPTAGWEETSQLPIRQLSADPGFVFLWVGPGDEDGLEKGRECLAKWGFRRAEDIVWVKTTSASTSGRADSTSAEKQPENGAGVGKGVGGGGLLASQKEHCLMGIRGTVRRSTDTRFVHCNVDTDVMVWEDIGHASSPRFPPYLYTLIESFCLGTRRLELFGDPAHARRGWVTAATAPALDTADLLKWDPAAYPALLPPKQDGRDFLPYADEIEALRPKSPVKGRRPQGGAQSHGPPRGGGPSRGVAGGRGRGGHQQFNPHQGCQQQQQPGFPQQQFVHQPFDPALMSFGPGGMDDLSSMGMGGMLANGPGMGMPSMPGMPGFNPAFAHMDPQMVFMMAHAQAQAQQAQQLQHYHAQYGFDPSQQQRQYQQGQWNPYGEQGGMGGHPQWGYGQGQSQGQWQ